MRQAYITTGFLIIIVIVHGYKYSEEKKREKGEKIVSDVSFGSEIHRNLPYFSFPCCWIFFSVVLNMYVSKRSPRIFLRVFFIHLSVYDLSDNRFCLAMVLRTKKEREKEKKKKELEIPKHHNSLRSIAWCLLYF